MATKHPRGRAIGDESLVHRHACSQVWPRQQGDNGNKGDDASEVRHENEGRKMDKAELVGVRTQPTSSTSTIPKWG